MKNQAEIFVDHMFPLLYFCVITISADSQNNLNDATTRHTVCFLCGKET